jgi:hypothetical protein
MRYRFQQVQRINKKMEAIMFVARCLMRTYIRVFGHTKTRSMQVESKHIPWLWIGAELRNKSIITLTDEINHVIEYGDCVDEAFLQMHTQTASSVDRWLYLDASTLIEKEIPPEGLLIQDDPNDD